MWIRGTKTGPCRGRHAPLAWAVAAGLLLSGCSARQYRENIDARAYEIIETKQQQALDKTEPFSIERPSDTLRRRLLLAHDLPFSSPASLGTEWMPKPPHWPEPVSLSESENPARSEPRNGSTLARGDAAFSRSRAPALPGQEQSAATATAAGTNNPPRITLFDALQIAAANSREYQDQKEAVFRSALELELERDRFRTSFAAVLSALFRHDRSALENPGGQVHESVEASGIGEASRLLKNGSLLSLRLGLNLVRLLQPARFSSESVFGDASISVPLLRGAGRHIAAEPLTQAERDVVYSLYEFEHFKRAFAVGIASEYLGVLQRQNAVENAAENYRGLIASARRARRLLDAGKLPAIQVDQSIQEELNARNRWVRARESFATALDQFKTSLGLPPDAPVELDSAELIKLSQELTAGADVNSTLDLEATVPAADAPIVLETPSGDATGSLELSPAEAIEIALEHRLDLENAIGRVHDAQRRVVVAANRLRPELTLFGSASFSEEELKGIHPDRGNYTALLSMDLPLERTAEAVAYRNSYIVLEAAVRRMEELEDQIKLAVMDRLRELREALESLRIQALSAELARRRVRGASLNLEAGRVEMRDLLEAQEDLLSAQNGLTAAAVDFRVAQLALQRDLGLLQVDSRGMWTEVDVLEN